MYVKEQCMCTAKELTLSNKLILNVQPRMMYVPKSIHVQVFYFLSKKAVFHVFVSLANYTQGKRRNKIQIQFLKINHIKKKDSMSSITVIIFFSFLIE